jgi:hypothetical protein
MDSQIQDFIYRAKSWQSGHSNASVLFQRIEWLLGIPSVFLGAIILGFAFYAVERTNTPLWTQYSLAGLSVVQGILISVQAYLRPAAMAEQHRATAARYAGIAHAYEKLSLELASGRDIPIEQFEKVMSEANDAAKEARLLPRYIVREIKKSLNRP